ncbi:MAG: hypothetical protein M3R17_16440 [Bacteroidota bacterium]|nr:hypothetical protein [Bacteroidota bacterium]
MKTNRIIFNTCMIVAAAGLMLTGCKKDEEDNDTSAASDNAFAEAAYNDVTNISDEAGVSGTLSNYRTGPAAEDGILTSCATITFDSVNSADQDTIHINFGTTNCTGNDGRNRRGEILVYYSGAYRDSASTHTITFNNYFVNDNEVLGTKIVTNLGHNASGNLVYDININGQIHLANNAGTITWTSQRQREWTQGESTMIWSDDVYSITGSASGTGSDGHTFTASITNPLIRNMAIGCRRHFVQGTFVLTPDNRPARTVDFGTGTCDDVATVTINTHTYTIHLR